MKLEMPKLPYALDSLSPKLSEECMAFHYGKHLQTYVDNLNKLIAGTHFEEMPLKEIIKESKGGIFNNAAQVFNHQFFFDSLSPSPTTMSENFTKFIGKEFGSVEHFKDKFLTAGATLFGSGWI